MFDCGKFLLVACKYIEFKQVVRFYNPPLVSDVAERAKPILELKPSSLYQLSNCNEKSPRIEPLYIDDLISKEDVKPADLPLMISTMLSEHVVSYEDF
jgi:hypothetical protein